MRLNIVLEIGPKKYALNGNLYQDEYLKNKIDQKTYWLKCLTESNLENLQPIKENSYFVDVETISDEALTIILDKELEVLLEKNINEINWEEYKDEQVFLHGGLVLEYENKVIIEPTCCTDLGDISNWEEIKTAPEDKWIMLWIGHPWIFYRRKNTIIEFSDYTQTEKGLFPKYQLNLAEFYQALEKIKLKKAQFEKRVKQILEEMNLKHAAEIAQGITANT